MHPIYGKTLWIITVWFCFLAIAHGQTMTEPVSDLVNAERLKNLSYEKQDLGKATAIQEAGQPGTVLDVETFRQPDFIHNLAVRIPLKNRDLTNGEVLLLSFKGKTIRSSLETGEARMLWVLNVSEEIKDRIKHTISISSDWKSYDIPIRVPKDIKRDDLSLVLQFGFPPQKFQLKDISLKEYGPDIDIGALPKTRITYAGMEPNATWRTEAIDRIKKIRSGAFSVTFTRGGKPIGNKTVEINLKHHDFKWGAAVGADELINNKACLAHFTEAFDIAVFENDLKIKFWNRPGRQDQVLKAMDLLEDAGIAIKGHVLIWPGFNHLPGHFRKFKDNPDKIRKAIDRHLRDLLGKTKGRISHWDVVNEAYTNQDLQKITGSEEILYHGFREALRLDPDAGRYVNEYGIISKGGLDSRKQKWYFDYIQRIDENTGGLVDGIGLQCHMGSDLTPPEKVLEILDFYGQLGKKISISEFTMEIDDPEVRRQYTADFMTAAFSHQAVTEFLFWGFQEEKADLFDANWRPGSMGKAFFDKVHGEWATQIVGLTGQDGRIAGTGFFGTYTYRFVEGNQIVSGTFEFLPDSQNDLRVKVD